MFTCWEEHGGGSVPFLLRHLYERQQISQCLIGDVTWVTEGITPGNGAVISMRDYNIPRKSFINRVIQIADQGNVPFQLEVEASGSSDGREIQISPYPLDWCFIGVPQENPHSPNEKVSKVDILAMRELLSKLFRSL